MHGLAARAGGYVRVHYEEFTRDPTHVVQRVLASVGAPRTALTAIHGHTLTLGTDHTASGNPMRFEQGILTVKPDEEWRTRMAARDRRLVTLGTLPLLLAYGYVRPRGHVITRPAQHADA
jgi:hypothetical protein